MTAVAQSSTIESIKQRFSSSQITRAAIVDDTYDGLTAEYLSPKLDKFVDALGDEDHLPELQKIMPGIAEADRFDVDAAKVLLEKKTTWPPKIVPLATELLGEFETKASRLNDLRKALEALGLQVQVFGAKPPNQEELAEMHILFLDYQLEPVATATAATAAAETGAQAGQQIDLSQNLAVKIATKLAEGAKRPFLVLISSIPTLAEIQAGFRERTNYVGGTFGFLPKEKAATPSELYYHIRGWGIGHPALPAVTDFISTLQRSASKVAQEFGATLLKLEVQDYSFIQRLSLEADGEPLGEYMLHLVSESLSHRLRNNPDVIAARQKLDKIRFESHLPSTVNPGDTVSHLYREAFTDRGEEELGPHPLQHAQIPAPATVFDRVMQGDIFRAPGEKKVYVVVNCGCQLQFSPINPKRQPKPETMLLLLEGALKSYSEPISSRESMRTEPFLIDDIPYRIVWKSDEILPVRRGEFGAECTKLKLKRIARLRDVQAAAIQQYWAATTARIGLPVAPPSFSSADYELYILADDKWTKTGDRVVGQVILTDYVGDNALVRSFTLTSVGLLGLAPGFAAAATALKDALEKNPPAGEHAAEKKTATESRITAAETLAGELGGLFELMEKGYELERKAGACWKPGSFSAPIGFVWQLAVEGKKEIKGISGKPLLIVNVLPPQGTETSPPFEPEAQ